jgi:[ribosomal protein S5]-alanine N-acetyltransferase
MGGFFEGIYVPVKNYNRHTIFIGGHMEFPVLETERLNLREIKTEDAQNLFINFSNPEVMKHYGSELMDDIEEARGLIHSFHIGFEEEKSIRWGIQLKDTNNLIGTVGFHAISAKNRRAEIGYELNQEYWGKGLAKEAILKVVEYGFEKMRLKRIGAVVFLENESSSKLLLKIGFHKEGILRDYIVQNGNSYDTNVYSLLAPE